MKTSLQKINFSGNSLIHIGFGVLFLLFSLQMIFNFHYMHKTFTPNRLFIFLAAATLFALGFFAVHFLHKLNKRRRLIVRTAFVFLLFVVQLYLFWKTSFQPGWDADLVVGAAINGFTDMMYFSKFPNNLFITVIMQLYLAATDFLFFISPLKRLIILNIVLVDLAIMFLYLSTRRVFGERRADVALLLGIFLFGFNPWLSTPYTDTFGSLFPIAMLYCIIRIFTDESKKNVAVFSALLGAFAVVGAYIKITSIIVVVALAMLILINLFSKKSEALKLKKEHIFFLPGVCATLLMVFLLLFPSNARIEEENPTEVPRGIFYFLETGLALFGAGSWNSDTFYWTGENIKNDDYEQQAVERILAILQDYGVLGTAQHLYLKTLWNGTDGTFTYGMEGAFHTSPQDSTDTLRGAMQSYVYATSDFFQNTLSQIMQALWLIVCLFGAVSIFNKDDGDFTLLARLAVGGLFVFLMLFEGRSRYVFLYVPVIIFAVQSVGYRLPLLDRKK